MQVQVESPGNPRVDQQPIELRLVEPSVIDGEINSVRCQIDGRSIHPPHLRDAKT